MFNGLADFSRIAPAINTFGIIGMIVSGVIAFLLAAIKIWPKIKEIGLKQREFDAGRYDERLMAVEAEAKAAREAAHAAEMKLVYAVSAVQLLAVRVRTEWPEDAALKQAMELLAAATTGAFPGIPKKLADGLAELMP